MTNSAYQRGRAYFSEGNDACALIALEEALRVEPKHYKAAFGIGLTLQRLGEHENAIEAFSNVLRIEPTIAEAFYMRGLCFQALRKHREALVDMECAINLNPEYTDARYGRAVSLKFFRYYEEALREYDRVLAKGPYPGASHGRATVRHLSGDYLGAISDYTVYIDAGNNSAMMRHLRGVSNSAAHLFREAIADFTYAIEMNPMHANHYLQRHYAFKSIGEIDSAKEDWEMGMRLLNECPGEQSQ